jgi:plastocyanin
MTLLLPIFSSLLLANVVSGAAVSGTVELTGSRIPAVTKHKDYSGVVVWLEPPSGSPPPAPRRAEMVQKDKAFRPHVLAIPVASIVNFPNYDPIFHNAFSNYSGQVFDVGLYPPFSSRKVTFRREGIVRVFCNIHPSMSAVIVVLRSPYFTVTRADGSWTIPNVAPGVYTLHVFHERATDATLESLSRKITINGEDSTGIKLSISEAGYIETPHKNKFGKDYSPPPDDASTYPGAKK